jgi:hypothetical protein
MLRGVLVLALLFSVATVDAEPRVFTVPAGEPPLTGRPLPFDALPDTHVGHGSNDILDAWFAEPTERLPHGILGDWLEAKALRVRTRSGAILSYRLPGNTVFEDLYPRVHDIDNDGHDEVIVVHSRPYAGSSVMALGVRDGALVPLAETEPVGATNRWVNPVGVADVDGDGRLELVVVLTPHIGGTLVAYRLEPWGFRMTHSIPGFSNHAIGSRAMRLGAFVDINGDGIPEVIVPSPDRRMLRAISFSTGVPLDLAQIALPSPAAGDFEFHPPYTLVVPLEDGRRSRIVWR